MLRRILARLAVACATLFAVSALVFLGTEALPGDAATATLGREATPELLAQYRAQLGLNKPLLERYQSWLRGFLRGDLGKSAPNGEPVWKLISDKARNTAALAIATLILLLPLALALGILSALWRDRMFDHTIAITTLVLISSPEFVVGTLIAIALGVWLNILPPLSLIDANQPLTSQLQALVLPVLTLLAISVAQMTRMVRAILLDVLRSDFVQVATLKGASKWRILAHHALPNAAGPVLQVIAFTVGWLVGGIVIVENVFQFPGLGVAVTNAVLGGDLPTVEAVTMLMTAVYLGATLVADIGAILIDPRLRRRT